MKKELLSKALVMGVIFLFVGVGVQSAFAIDITLGNEKQQLENKFSITTNPVFPLGGIFMKTFGGGGEDWGQSVQQTTDGGYIVTGYISGDACLIKTFSNGTKEWEKTFDRVKSVQDILFGKQMMADTSSLEISADMLV